MTSLLVYRTKPKCSNKSSLMVESFIVFINTEEQINIEGCVGVCAHNLSAQVQLLYNKI